MMPHTAQHQVFLSYHSEDEAMAEEIARQLQQKYGIQVWMESWSVVPGTLTQKAKEEGLAKSDACSILIGAHGIQGWQELDVYSSIERRIETDGSSFPVIPVYLPSCPDEVKKVVPGKLRLYEPVIFTAVDDPTAMRRLVCGIHGQPPGDKPPDQSIPCPFPGLDSFREDMAQYFFGRETEIQELQELLNDRSLVVAIGPSGCGKSSLVLAGLVPRLRGTESNPSPYLIHVLTPGREPLQRLAMCFVSQPSDPYREQLASRFADDKRELSRAIYATLQDLPSKARRVLLVVDQFEEVFNLCDNAAQRDAFILNLLTACEETNGDTQVVLTLRSDFYTPCFQYRPLVDRESQLAVRPMTRERMRYAIEQSAHQAGLYLQRGLVDMLLNDASDEPGILPLVQYTLRQLFERRNGRWLTLDAYLDPGFGGVQGVIAKRAESALAKLMANPEFRADQVEEIARRILLRMVNIGETGDPTRQHVFKEDFFWSSDTVEQRGLLEAGLNLFIQERLLNSDQIDTHEGTQRVVINLAHEVVIKAWPRLNSWVDTYKGDLLMRGRIESRAHAWKESEYQDDRLLRGSELSEALEWQKRRI